MPYQRNTWARGDTITSAKLNNLEQGVADLSDAEQTLGDLNNIVAGHTNTLCRLEMAVDEIAEGAKCTGIKDGEGTGAVIMGDVSGNTAAGVYAHAEGGHTTATHRSQHVLGEYNAEDPSANDGAQRGNYVEIVGNGSGANALSNARTLDWEGNERLAGGLTLGMGTADETTITPAQLKALLALLS